MLELLDISQGRQVTLGFSATFTSQVLQATWLQADPAIVKIVKGILVNLSYFSIGVLVA